MTYSDNKRDANEPELVKFWRDAGCVWIPMNRLAGFDGLLVDTSGMYIIEVKQPGKQLTMAERARRDEVEALGGDYHVIHNIQEAAALIGLEVATE